MSRYFFVLMTLLVIFSTAIPASGTKDDDLRTEGLQESLDWMVTGYEDMGWDVFDAGYSVLQEDVYSLNFDLDEGYYRFCCGADDFQDSLRILIVDNAGEFIARDDNGACYQELPFIIAAPMTISVNITDRQTEFSTYDEPAVYYFLTKLSGLDEESRINYVNTRLDASLELNANPGREVYQRGLEHVTQSSNPLRLEMELDEGLYEFSGEPDFGIEIMNLNVYDQNGQLIDPRRCEFPDTRLWFFDPVKTNRVWYPFNVQSHGIVTIEIDTDEFAPGVNDGYIAWVLTNYVEMESYGGGGSFAPGFNPFVQFMPVDMDGLIENAENLLRDRLPSTEDSDEEIVESVTEPLYYTGEQNGWVYEPDFDNPGSYNIYVQGDNICLTDIDMVIYLDGVFIDRYETTDNSIDAAFYFEPDSGHYEIIVYAYELECGEGYFSLRITRDGNRKE
jgi:hypothetical protein